MHLHAVAGCTLVGLCVAASAASAASRATQDRPAVTVPRAAAAPEGNAYYYFVAGRHLESEGDVEGAVKAYHEAAALDPRSAEIRAELAALYARQNRTQDAREWAEAALKLDADNAEANRVLGIIDAGLAKLDDDSAADNPETVQAARAAARHLEAARTRMTGDPSLDFTLGRLYLKLGQDDQAIAALRRVADADTDRGEPTALLAEAYVHAGRTADAIRLLESASESHPEFYASLGELYENGRRWKDAAGAYERALARNPRNVELRTRLAVVLLSHGGQAEAGKAAAILEEARKLSPTDTQVLYLLAEAQRNAGKLDAAETSARQLAAMAPGGATAAYALAQVYDEKQQYRRVVDTLSPVVEGAHQPASGSDPRMAAAVLMLGSAYQELGEFDRALAAFDRARAMAPDNRNIAVYTLGVLVSARRFDEALQRSQQLLADEPRDSRVIRLRAEALRGAGRADEGVKLLEDLVASRPDDPTGYLALSELHAGLGRFDAATRVLDDASKRFASDLTVRFQLASVFERAGRWADAERVFREVLAKDPMYAPALNYLGYMLANRGQHLDESVALIKRALSVEPYNGAYLDSLGWAYFKADRLDLAEEPLRKAAEQRVRDSAVQDHFGDLMFRLGRYNDAIAAWRQALAGDREQVDAAGIERKIRSAGEKAAKQ